jgi:cytochrome c peroxidase
MRKPFGFLRFRCGASARSLSNVGGSGGNMRPYLSLVFLFSSSVAASLLLITDVSADGSRSQLRTPDQSGILETVSSSTPVIDLGNPFFKDLGTNGRACVTCHVPDQAWSITPTDVRHRFDTSDGTDPIFRTVDGSNSPNADISTADARRRAYSMLLSKGVIRVGIGIPAEGEFTLVAVDHPYHFANANQPAITRPM